MSPTTGDPLNLDTWAKGKKNWHVEFNDNMDAINQAWQEIVDARGGASDLDERLDNIEPGKVENNLILEAFRRMIGDAQAGADAFQDGWVDTLQDESNVDLPNCINQYYDAAGDFYQPTQNGSPNNMTLVFKPYEAEAEPVESKVLFILEDVDPITLNTDIKVFVTLDDWSTEEQITLEDVGDFETNQRIIVGTRTMTPQSDQTTGVKITTHNNKDLKIHCVANMLHF